MNKNNNKTDLNLNLSEVDSQAIAIKKYQEEIEFLKFSNHALTEQGTELVKVQTIFTISFALSHRSYYSI